MRNGHVTEKLIAKSVAMNELRGEIARVARSERKVLITRVSRVRKELVAGAVHVQSGRSHRPFVAVNCAGIPETLLESELFGHVKGSFTGAYRDKPGKLEMAADGTIFLDEIGEMTLRMQGLLLRFLETGDVQKVGAHRTDGRVDVRVIAATNRNLRDLISNGQFREDLFYRLNVIHINVPPLRDRRDDIPILIDFFLNRFTEGTNGSIPNISPEAMEALTSHTWAGNVRELENVIERIIVRGRGEMVTLDDLPPEVRTQHGVAVRPKRERRLTVAGDLYKPLTEERETLSSLLYPLSMQREITKGNVRDLVRKVLEESRGNYKIVSRIFNMQAHEYKKFLNFLRKHDCQLPFKDYR